MKKLGPANETQSHYSHDLNLNVTQNASGKYNTKQF